MAFRLATIARHLTKKPQLYPVGRFGISRILKSKTPENYSHRYYWLKRMTKNSMLLELLKNLWRSGYPQMIFLEAEINDVLMEGDSFAVIENEKAVVSLEAPFDNAKLVTLDEDVDFDIINEDPVNIENKLCVFENLDDSNKPDLGDVLVAQNGIGLAGLSLSPWPNTSISVTNTNDISLIANTF